MIELVRRLLSRAQLRPTQPLTVADMQDAPENVATLQRYASLCEAAGVDRLYLLLTFDCDTDGDIDAAPALHRELERRGIKAGYAVPGVQLEKGAPAWRRLAERGAEFLNHGGRAHAEFRDGRYWPITFYDKLGEGEVAQDVQRGHQLVLDVLGVRPVGFRAPHFGSFQRPEQLAQLYKVLRPLRYTYASTTIPEWALTRGPFIAMDGLVEIPTMGSFRNPRTLLDSWTYLTDRTHYTLGNDYYELFEETLREMTARRLPGVLTYYADPSHVFGQRPFEQTLEVITQYGIPTLHGREAVHRFRAL